MTAVWLTCGVALTSLLLFHRHRHEKGRKVEVAWSAEPHEGVQSTQKCGSMQPIWMTQLLVAFFPAGEMCGFVKHFRKKKVLKLISPFWKLYLYKYHEVCSIQKLPLKHLLFLFWILEDTSHPLFYSAFNSRMMKSKVWFGMKAVWDGFTG